jgi:hypothetical protein
LIIVNKDSVEAVRLKLDDPDKFQEAFKDIEKFLEIKQALLWRAEAGTCCGSLDSVASFIAREITILENILVAMGQRDINEAARLLQEYKQVLEANNEPSQPRYC